MTISSFVFLGFATVLVGAACTPTPLEVNAERTAACADRTNNISCNACCLTEKAVYENGACACKGKSAPAK